VRACVIPSLSRNCIVMSAHARIGSSSAHFTSIPLSPCSTRKWAALEGGGGPSPRGGASPRGPPEAGGGACPAVVGPPGCGEGVAAGASCRGAPDGVCGGCAKLAVAKNAAATPKHTDGLFNPTLLRNGVAAPDLKTGDLSTLGCGSRSGLNGFPANERAGGGLVSYLTVSAVCRC
jgi:hypothetical protein